MSLLIKDAKLLVKNKAIVKDIYIENGKIIKITNEKIKADETINANSNFVITGLIDPHVHFREPGLTHKEDFLTGSRAAAAGGVTTILDMPNTIPQTITIKDLEDKRELAKKSVVNYGFHFGGAKDNLEEIKKARNIASIKVFMNISTGKMLIEDDEVLREIFSNTPLVMVHAEDEMIPKAVRLTKRCNNQLYLCHVSRERDMDFIQKNRTNKMLVEVCTHHLFLDKSIEKKLKGFAEVKPPLATKKDQTALWNAVKAGWVDTISTDHAPHTIEEKISDNPPSGMPGVETRLPLLLDAVNKKNLSLTQVITLTSENPAKIFGIKNKAQIKIGYDADLTIIDMKKTKVIKNEELFTKCKWSPYNGWKLKGLPVTTIVNGNVVFNDGQVFDKIKGEEIEIVRK